MIEDDVAKLINVDKIYNSVQHRTAGVRNISITFTKGNLTLLLGPSGSGKTTLLTLIAGLIEPTSGTVTLFNRQVESYQSKELQKLRAERIGFVFQTFHLIESLTVIKNVELTLRFAGIKRSQVKMKAMDLLSQFGLSHLFSKYPSMLSQGEKQRVAIARAIANDADLIIADEPTSSLESKQGFEIINLLHQYARNKQKCVVVASHDLRLKEFADHIIQLEDGFIQSFN